MAALFVLPAPAATQQAGVEDRLREALRRTTTELRALQDAQAREQAELEEAKRQRDLSQQQLDRQAARIAELEGQAAASKPSGTPAAVSLVCTRTSGCWCWRWMCCWRGASPAPFFMHTWRFGTGCCRTCSSPCGGLLQSRHRRRVTDRARALVNNLKRA